MDTSPTATKVHIFLRNLIRDRTSGSTDEYQTLGGHAHIARVLKVDVNSGVSSSDVATRRTEHGSNVPPEPETTTYWEFLLEAFSDFTVIMLCCAAGVSLILAFAYEKTAGSYAEGFAILVSVLLVTNVTAVNDYKKQQQFMRLNAAVDDISVRCVRNGVVCDVKSVDLVCGDVVQLSVGDILTVDGVLFRADNVSTDESALTGEPKLIRKDPNGAPFLLSGTKVMEGSGFFIVVAVGENSEAGQIRELIRNKKKTASAKKEVPSAPAAAIPSMEGTLETEQSDAGGEEKSVLTAKLDRIAIQVGKAATVIALVALIVMCVRFAVVTFAISNPDTVCATVSDELCSSQAVADYASDPTVGFPLCSTIGHSLPCCSDTADGAEILGAPCPWMKNHLGEILSFVITAITILVVAVPEGLPLAVTLSLAFSVRKMQSENNLVKHLDACETMGSATTICSDKTGTLTKNRMTVVKSLVGTNRNISLKTPQTIPPWIQEILGQAICLSGNSDISWNEQIRLWDQIGSKTECALLQTIRDDLKLGQSYLQIRKVGEGMMAKKFPFSSAAKKCGFVLKTADGGFRLCTIGASEIILDSCSSFVNTDSITESSSLPLSQAMRNLVEKTIEEFANQAMRTVCIAYKDIPGSINLDSVSADEKGLIFVALVGIEDPLRDEVPLAIRKCNRAGVDVKMVTGDNLNTAIAIARNCNIIRQSDLDPATNLPKPNVAMTGPDFRRAVLDADGNLKQAELDKIWPHLRVLARSSPTDKYTLVTGMIESKLSIAGGDRQVVAVTGDGTNDAPALKKADVGFAMGITGTAVARDAADIILLDDNFASIVVACKWGRNVYDSIAKFLQFQLTVNVVAVTIAIEGAFINNESPIGAVQMLWVNLIMDALASLALATEPPTDALLDRLPHGRNQSAISNIMVWNVLGQAVFQLTVLNLIFFCGPDWFDIPSGVGRGHNASASEHYTLMFNALVLMQLSNQINSRKLYHEPNVFRGLFANFFFVSIVFVESFLQVIFVQFGGEWVSTAPLPGWLWGVCIAICIGSFPVQLIIIFLRRWVVGRARKVVTSKASQGGEMIANEANQDFNKASVISPLPTGKRLPEADVESGLRVTESAQNLGQASKQGSGNLRSFSTRNLKELVTAPGVEQLKRSKTGGFKNPRRQAATNVRFRKMYSFANASAAGGGESSHAEFVEAARKYHQN